MGNDQKSEKYIEKWLKALEKERIHQQLQFGTMLQEQAISKRVGDGYTWYPLKVASTGYTIGELPYVLIEKTKSEKQDDHFQPGQPVQFFRMDEGERGDECKGVIHWMNKGQMKIILHLKELPEWLGQGGLGVDLLHDERTFNQMKKSMESLINSKSESSSSRLKEIFYGESAPSEIKQKGEWTGPEFLNSSQKEAIQKALNCEEVSIIHGPPGTGKTTTLKYLIKALSERGEQVLVTAPSNAAVDLLTGLLSAEGLSVVRIGHFSRIDNEVLECSLEALVFSKREAKQIKKVRLQAEECRRQAARYKRNFGAEERYQRRELYREARSLSKWAVEIENRLIGEVIDQSNVICCTLSGADTHHLKGRKFKTCIIDEAAQALQGACWIAMSKAERPILAGDPFQLPPTVKSREAVSEGLDETLLDIAVKKNHALSLLDIQYRMNRRIMGFSNQWFYEGKLKADKSVDSHCLSGEKNMEDVVVFIDTAGCGFHEKQHPDSGSYYNRDEYLILREHLDPLLHRQFIHSPEVGILSPYSAQVKLMREDVEQEGEFPFPVSIRTIDSFQGQEKDVIYISLVRSNEKQQIGFLKDYRRMNVAMTRARKKLVILGDSSTIGSDPFYSELLNYIETEGTYKSAWEFIS